LGATFTISAKDAVHGVDMAAILFTICVFVTFGSFRIEDLLPSSQGEKYTTLPGFALGYPLQVLATLDAIWLLWWLAFASVILLRFFDHVWREKSEVARRTG
jgi:Na+/proline symporter